MICLHFSSSTEVSGPDFEAPRHCHHRSKSIGYELSRSRAEKATQKDLDLEAPASPFLLGLMHWKPIKKACAAF